MPFQPRVNDPLDIGGVVYRVGPHPSAPTMPYAQEGRQATVYQIRTDGASTDNRGQCALKVMKGRYRLPSLVKQAERLAAFADLPGLKVCRRQVLSPDEYAITLQEHPDLLYSVLMPWVSGPTWMEVLLYQRELTAEQSLQLARALATLLAQMTERGVAHGDLSGPNVLLPALAGAPAQGTYPISLVDIEQFYDPGLTRPDALPGLSAGYGHHAGAEGLWSEQADSFSGAILLGEMLGWCDERIRRRRWGESYFDPAEMQQDSERSRLLREALQRRWGDGVAALFERAWTSAALQDCPDFRAWVAALPDDAPPAAQAVGSQRPSGTSRLGGEQTSDPSWLDDGGAWAQEELVGVGPVGAGATSVLVAVARRLEEQGNTGGALEVYRAAGEVSPGGSPLRQEAELIVRELEDAGTYPREEGVVTTSAAVGGTIAAGAAGAMPATETGYRWRSILAAVLYAAATGIVVLIVAALVIAPRFLDAQKALLAASRPTAVAAAARPSLTATAVAPSPTEEPTQAAPTVTPNGVGAPQPTATRSGPAATATSNAAVAAIATIGAAEVSTAVANLPTPPPRIIVIERPAAPPVAAVTPDTRVPLPNVIGRTVDAASKILVQQGFLVARSADQASATTPAGSVTKEFPDPGRLLPRESTIVLTVSSGPPQVAVPGVVGQQQADAQAALARVGLNVALQEQTSTLPDGVVLAQVPAAGASAPPGSAVTLTVSVTQRAVVPNVVGMPEGQAQATIQAAGLATTFPNRSGHDPTIQIGSVESQSPVAGDSVPVGTVVYINVRT